MDVEQHRSWLVSLIDLPVGGTILDVGCGEGADLRALAALNSDPTAIFVGIDSSPHKIAAAKEAIADDRISFEEIKVGERLVFDDASFDVVLTQEMMECLSDPGVFAAEVARTLKPGGQVVASHYDWDTQVFAGSDKDRTRKVVRAWADSQQSWMDNSDPWMGRRLWGVFQGSGLFDGEVRIRVMNNTDFSEPLHGYRLAHWMRGSVKRGLVTSEEYDAFLADLESLSAQGRYFWSVNRYVYVGRKRGA